MERIGNNRGARFAVLGYLLLTAWAMITLCSRSSPLYPLNDWDDANCFFTVGKAMFSGRVLSRDIYEQKGFLLYVVYGLAWLISRRGFFGAYLIEIACFFVFLRLVWGTLRLFMDARPASLLCPLLAAVLCGTRGFYLGGSVEELALPVLYYPICTLIQGAKLRCDCIPTRRQMVLLGAGAAVLLWSKFTLLGIYIAYVLFAIVYLLRRREAGRLFQSAGLFLLGFVIVTLPVLAYFVCHGALGDLWTAYFYNNIFLYSPERSAARYAFILAGAVWQNLLMMVLIALGVVWVLRSKLGKAFRWGMFCLYFGNAFFIYAGGAAFEYYAYGLAALSVTGLLALYELGRVAAKRFPGLTAFRRVNGAAAALLVIILCGGLAFGRSMNRFYASYRAEDMWYTHFAERILASEDTSLFNYNCLDRGLYTVTGVVPETKYFCKLNIPLQEMYDECERYLRDGETAWVVTSLRVGRDEEAFEKHAALLEEKYELAAEERSFFRDESLPEVYYLYHRR